MGQEKPARRVVWWATLVIVAASGCAATRPASRLPELKAGSKYDWWGLSIRSPGQSGWRLIQASRYDFVMGRNGEVPGETFIAHVSVFPLPEAGGPTEFVAQIKKAATRDSSSDRFTILETDTRYAPRADYPCARFKSLIRDQKAQITPTRRESLLLQVDALYCRHPHLEGKGFAVIYSHRGHSRYPNLEADARAFRSGVQVRK